MQSQDERAAPTLNKASHRSFEFSDARLEDSKRQSVQSLQGHDSKRMSRQEAILESVRARIQSISMTTRTTVLGLLPLVMFPGAGSELYRGLGSVVLGGLIVSTVLTLFWVPTLFSLTLDIKEWLTGLVFGKTADAVSVTTTAT